MYIKVLGSVVYFRKESVTVMKECLYLFCISMIYEHNGMKDKQGGKK